MLRTILRHGPVAALLPAMLHPPGLSAAELELASGWINYGGSYAPAQAARQERLCVVSGLVRSKNGQKPRKATVIGKLSGDCRPAERLIFNVNDHEQTARVDVYPDGRVIWRSGFGRRWVSLSGITFAVGKIAALKLNKGWTSYGGPWQRAAVARVGNRCVVSGLVKARRRIALPSTVAVLPPPCRPRKRLIYDLHANSHRAATRVDVLRDGRVMVRGAFDRWLSLSGISFRASAAARKAGRRGGNALRLVTGWRNYGRGYQEATYWIEGSVCTLSGLISGRRNGHIATVPARCRPEKRLIFNVHARNASVRVDVRANGSVEWVTGGKGGWISLAGIDIPTAAGARARSPRIVERPTAAKAEKRRTASKRRTQITRKARAGRIAPSAPVPRAESKARSRVERSTATTSEKQRVDRVGLSKRRAQARRKARNTRISTSKQRAKAAVEAQIDHVEAPAKAAVAGKPRIVRAAPSIPAAIGAGPVLVVHENGGNVLLRRIADSQAVAASLPGDLSPQERLRIEHERTVRLEPAWVYALTSPVEFRGVRVAGEGVTTQLVDPSCITLQDEGLFTSEELCDPPTAGRTLHVRFTVQAGAAPGNRDILLELPSRETRRYGTLKIARAGSATLVEAAYLPPDLDQGRIVPIPVPELRNGRPIIGELPARVLGAPAARLTFAGNGVGGLKLAAPECLISAQHEAIGSDRLRVTARFRVPAAIRPGSHGLVSRIAELPSAPCTWVLYDPALDPVVNAEPRHAGNAMGNFTFLVRQESTISVMPQYLTMAGIGDSYSAGEGAPDAYDPAGNFAEWELGQCHRSSHSQLTQAARKVAEVPGVWIIYRNFACSGATIHVGFLGPYMGVPTPVGQPSPDPVPPQKEQLTDWLSSQNLTLDVLLIGFGGNEAGFSTAIAKCVAPDANLEVQDHTVAQLPQDCHEQDQFLNEINNGSSTALRGLVNLDDAFDDLAGGLSDINPGNIFVMEYPDPLSYSANDRCNKFVQFDDHYTVLPEHVLWGDLVDNHPLAMIFDFGGKLGNLTYDEVVWLRENFLARVNQEIEQAAARHDWTYVSGHVEHSVDHGFCTRGSYIHSFRSSKNTQGDFFGSVHPTAEAYHIYGDVIARKIIPQLDLPPRPGISVIQQGNSQQPPVVVLGDTHADDPQLVNLVHADPTRFWIQLAPTTRALDVRFRFQRKNRYSGADIGGVQSVSASLDDRFEVRTEYVVDRTLNICETLEYGWDIVHSGPDGTRTLHTESRRITPAPRFAGEDGHCPGR